MISSFFVTLKRDLLLVYRHRIEILNPIAFFVLVTLLFPLAITSDPKKLMLMGPGVIWIALLFANMLSIDSLFLSDFEDGTLEQIFLKSNSFPSQVLAKLAAHWLTTSVPLLLISIVLSKVFFLSNKALIVLILSLLLGSPVLTMMGAIGGALTLGLRTRGLLLVLMVLPLYLPILIFGAGAVNDASLNLPVLSQLCFLAAFLTFSITFTPFAIAAALKISLE